MRGALAAGEIELNAGLPTTAACPDFTYLPTQTAPAAQRLLDAGALLVGKTNMDQFATGLSGTRSPHGAPANAFDAAYICGGSSSGSALALAHGLVSFALGTDTAGSGRVPAALGNLIGLKPSRGLVSSRGVLPACRSLDCVSVFALTSADAAAVLDVIAGFDAEDAFARDHWPVVPAPGAGFRFGVPRPDQLDFDGDATGAEAFARSVAALQALGFLAGNEDTLARFMGLAGVSVDELKTRAGDPAFLGGVLDFVDMWTARRLIRLINHGPLLVAGRDAAQAAGFFRCLGRQTVFLSRRWKSPRP